MIRVIFCSLMLVHSAIFAHTVSAEIYFSIAEFKNMYTGMQTTKVELAESEANCKKVKAITRADILTNEYLELISLSCSAALPTEYNNIVFNRPTKGALYLVYEKAGIPTKEIFYVVEPAWTNVKACEAISSEYKKVDPKVFCVGGLAK